MTVEQLLIPRVIVNHWYPSSVFDIGECLQQKALTLQNSKPIAPIAPVYMFWGINSYVLKADIDKSIESGANIFEYLPWHEGRLLEDMPTYLHEKSDAGYFVFEGAYTIPKGVEYGGADMICVLNPNLGYYMPLAQYPHLMPATEQQYKDYLKNKAK